MKSFNEHRGAVKESGENELGDALQGISASIEMYRSVIGTANVNADTEKLSAAEKKKVDFSFKRTDQNSNQDR